MLQNKRENFHRYGSRIKRKPFQVLEKCQKLSANLVTLTAAAPKNYKNSLVQKIIDISYELIHTVRVANSYRLYESARAEYQNKAWEHAENISDQLPVLRMCRVLSPGQEAQLEQSLQYVRTALLAWIESDQKRMEEEVTKSVSVILKNTNDASTYYDQLDLTKELSLLEAVKAMRFTDEFVRDCANALLFIYADRTSIEDFFLIGFSKQERQFVFANKSWTKRFGVHCTDTSVHALYRDKRGCFYHAPNISQAIWEPLLSHQG